MAQQVLQTVVTLSGKVDNTFGQIGQSLIALGSQVDGLSQKLLELGKAGIETYRGYEDGILETRSVLARQYSSSGELNKAMKSLEENAQHWASTTIFHTNDVADAMAAAAHAGWDYDKILAGMPASMLIAQAGNMDLTDSVDMLAKMLASTNTSFSQSERFIDQWARTADLVATDIPELGNAFLRLGSSAQFASSNEELFTMLAVLANVGTVGETAGTGVRNMMLRLIAPTKKAAEAMEGLGLTEEEIEEAFDGLDENTEAAYKRLQEFGFTAYDKNGNLRGMIDIFTDLSAALDQMPSEQEQNALLAAIFPSRTISYAKAMLNAVKDGSIYSIYQAIWGDSDGYAQEKSDIVMSGLSGSLEILGSKWEELKRKTGESLSPDVTNVANAIGDVLDAINGMDSETFNALVKGAEAIAITGPGLITVGGAFRLIGSLLTPTGYIALGVATLAAFTAALDELNKASMESKFGDLDLDTDALNQYVKGLGEGFNSAFANVNTFNTALEKSVEDYTTASSTFSGDLMTQMLTDMELTDADKTKLLGLGNDMVKALTTGIANSTASTMSFMETIFGGEGVAEDDPAYRELIGALGDAYTESVANAEALGQKLRDALTAAFADGHITPEEYANIKSVVEEINDAMVEAQRLAQEDSDYADMQVLLHKAQTAGLDQVVEYGKQIQTERDSKLQSLEDEYIHGRVVSERALGRKVEAGTMTQAEMDSLLAAYDARYESQKAFYSSNYDDALGRLWGSVIRESDLGDAYGGLETLAQRVLSGEIGPEAAVKLFQDAGYGVNWYAGEGDSFVDKGTKRSQLAQYLARAIASYGGYESVLSKADEYDRSGNSEMADYLYQLYAMDQINNNFARTGVKDLNGAESLFNLGETDKITSSAQTPGIKVSGLFGETASSEAFYADLGQNLGELTMDQARAIIAEHENMLNYVMAELDGKSKGEVDAAYKRMTDAEKLEFGRISDWITQNYDVGRAQLNLPTTPNGDFAYSDFNLAAISALIGNQVKAGTEAYRLEAEDTFAENIVQGVEVTDNGTGAATRGELETQFGEPIVQRVIVSRQGREDGEEGGNTLLEYAQGGRADAASIFGEAGPEWAIPEEHSTRTAALLDAAREASGFSWPELLHMTGGLNANAGNRPTQIIYSPTIYARDANGVAQKLEEDKTRLEKWFRQRQEEENMVVYR